MTGDLNEAVDKLIDQAPPDATLVVFHSAVLAYVDRDARDAFARKMRQVEGHWVSNEGPGVVAMADRTLPASPDPSRALFVVAHDGAPVAYADGHGQSLHWLG